MTFSGLILTLFFMVFLTWDIFYSRKQGKLSWLLTFIFFAIIFGFIAYFVPINWNGYFIKTLFFITFILTCAMSSWRSSKSKIGSIISSIIFALGLAIWIYLPDDFDKEILFVLIGAVAAVVSFVFDTVAKRELNLMSDENQQLDSILPAGFWIRWVAILIDNAVVGFIVLLISFLVTGEKEKDLMDLILATCYFVLLPFYWKGYTVGKRIVRIRIAKMNGGKLGIGTLFLREIIGAFVNVPTFGLATIISAFMIGLRKDKRAIHDLIARTHVIHDSH